jgi:3-oxoacyl-[acyl-carrier-protein] synthase-3
MEGFPLFRWATRELTTPACRAVELAGITLDELDVFIPHQANLRIVEAMAKQLKLPPHVAIARDIVRQGNTSAASVPLAIAGLRESGVTRGGELALLIGFGAGLVHAAQVAILP